MFHQTAIHAPGYKYAYADDENLIIVGERDRGVTIKQKNLKHTLFKIGDEANSHNCMTIHHFVFDRVKTVTKWISIRCEEFCYTYYFKRPYIFSLTKDKVIVILPDENAFSHQSFDIRYNSDEETTRRVVSNGALMRVCKQYMYILDGLRVYAIKHYLEFDFVVATGYAEFIISRGIDLFVYQIRSTIIGKDSLRFSKVKKFKPIISANDPDYYTRDITRQCAKNKIEYQYGGTLISLFFGGAPDYDIIFARLPCIQLESYSAAQTFYSFRDDFIVIAPLK